MKKVYKKPQVYIEKFELSQNIATCGWDMNQQTKETCVAIGDPEFGNEPDTVFTEYPRCSIDDYEAYCYENGAADFMRVFNS